MKWGSSSMYTVEYAYTALLTNVTNTNIHSVKPSTYNPQGTYKSPRTTQFPRSTYTGLNENPTCRKYHTEHKQDTRNAWDVRTATPLVPNRKPRNPELILLSRGNNRIKLIMACKHDWSLRRRTPTTRSKVDYNHRKIRPLGTQTPPYGDFELCIMLGFDNSLRGIQGTIQD